MTSDRPYRPAMTWAAAGREIQAESGGQFDPDVVEAFRSRERMLRRIRRQLTALPPARAVGRNLDLGRGRAVRRRGLVPEDDLALHDPEDRGGALPWPITAALPPVGELEGCGRRLAGGLDRDDAAGAGKRGVPGNGVRVGSQPQHLPGAGRPPRPGRRDPRRARCRPVFSTGARKARTTLSADGGLDPQAGSSSAAAASTASRVLTRAPPARGPGSVRAGARSPASGALRRGPEADARLDRLDSARSLETRLVIEGDPARRSPRPAWRPREVKSSRGRHPSAQARAA